jgi:hypothetical protein
MTQTRLLLAATNQLKLARTSRNMRSKLRHVQTASDYLIAWIGREEDRVDIKAARIAKKNVERHGSLSWKELKEMLGENQS